MDAARETKRIQIGDYHGEIVGLTNCGYFNTLPTQFGEHNSLFKFMKLINFAPHTVFDVGANIGLFTIAAATQLPDAKIASYEPNPQVAECLTVNTKPWRDRVMTKQCALGARKGEAMFFPGISRTSGAHLMDQAEWRGSGLSLPISTIDNEMAELGFESLDLLKIDVEGYEQDVLDGAATTLARCQPLIHLEVNSWCLIAMRNLNPRTFVESLGAKFAHVYHCRKDGGFKRLETQYDRM